MFLLLPKDQTFIFYAVHSSKEASSLVPVSPIHKSEERCGQPGIANTLTTHVSPLNKTGTFRESLRGLVQNTGTKNSSCSCCGTSEGRELIFKHFMFGLMKEMLDGSSALQPDIAAIF